MVVDLLQEARERMELVAPLRQGFEKLLKTYGTRTLMRRPTPRERFAEFVDLMLQRLHQDLWLSEVERQARTSLRNLRSLRVTLGEGQDQVRVWNWLNSQIIVDIEGLPRRLVLEEKPERSQIQEWKGKEWVPVRFPNSQDATRYQELLEALEEQLSP